MATPSVRPPPRPRATGVAGAAGRASLLALLVLALLAVAPRASGERGATTLLTPAFGDRSAALPAFALAAGGAEELAERRQAAEDEGGPAPLATSGQIAAAVAYVETQDRAGTGFLIDADRLLTSAHVVEGRPRASVRFAGGFRRIGRVVAVDERLDLAVIALPATPTGAAPLARAAEQPALALAVRAWGYPLQAAVAEAGFSAALTASEGIVSARRSREGIAFLQTDAAIARGSSGGPLTSADGLVVGVITTVLEPDGRDPEGLNFAIDLVAHANELDALLRAARAE
jgi:S1-C subfamily serine protease